MIEHDERHAAGLEHAPNLLHRPLRRTRVVQHTVRVDDVERVVLVTESLDVGELATSFDSLERQVAPRRVHGFLRQVHADIASAVRRGEHDGVGAASAADLENALAPSLFERGEARNVPFRSIAKSSVFGESGALVAELRHEMRPAGLGIPEGTDVAQVVGGSYGQSFVGHGSLLNLSRTACRLAFAAVHRAPGDRMVRTDYLRSARAEQPQLRTLDAPEHGLALRIVEHEAPRRRRRSRVRVPPGRVPATRLTPSRWFAHAYRRGSR